MMPRSRSLMRPGRACSGRTNFENRCVAIVGSQGFKPGAQPAKKIGSNLGPNAAENQVKRCGRLQNKAKRAYKIVFLPLVRDQGVGGSNPLAPTICLREFQTVEPIEAEPIEAEPIEASVDRQSALARLRNGIAAMQFSSEGPLPSREELHERP